ncbi:MAG: type II secretion system inner membrane protein GspF [Methylophilaceae bacterium]|nr:type II secretion system inner membrane protein GspF [Methylophilaceae bacterium]
MAVFKFEALDAAGKVSKGTVEGETIRLARSRLRDMQLTPLKVDALDEAIEASANSRFFEKKNFSSAELCLVTRQISTLLTAGLTVDQVLNAIVEQAEDEYTKEVMQGIRAEVMAGSTLSRALAKYPKIFPDIYRAIIFAGEESGELAKVTLRLAEYTESRNVLKQKVTMAFIYPALVTIVALLVVSGLLIYVVPQVVSTFEQSHQTLPMLTRALIALSDLLRVTWPYLLAVIVISIFAIRRALANQKTRFKWHEQLLKLPLLGGLVRGLNTARLASTLAILVGSGVPIISAMKAAAKIISNLPMRLAVDEAIDMVRDGTPLSRALKKGKLFPPILIHLISSAEATGRLDQMLESAAAQQTREMENRIGLLTALLEPVLILVMGAIVLAIVLAILLPIIEMNQLIK